MSYPEPRYLGSGGEVSATLRPPDSPPDLDFGDESAVHYLATGSGTGGDYGLYRWDMGPEPSGPSPHFHRTMSEAFYVLEGTVRLFDGTGWHEAGPGGFLHVPPGGIHGFRNIPGTSASMLILFTPGAPREAYFEALARFGAENAWPAGEELRAFFAEHDNHFI